MPSLPRRVFIPLIAFTALLGATGASAAPACPDHAQAFWQTFRSAALAQPPQVVPLTSFPFKVRASLDSDPVRSISKQRFDFVFDRLLASEVVQRDMTSITMKDLARNTPQLLPAMCNDDEFRVENWVFKRRRDAWRFAFAYIEEDELK